VPSVPKSKRARPNYRHRDHYDDDKGSPTVEDLPCHDRERSGADCRKKDETYDQLSGSSCELGHLPIRWYRLVRRQADDDARAESHVRPEDEFVNGHLPEALNIPLAL
jgi:hypothetical protein